MAATGVALPVLALLLWGIWGLTRRTREDQAGRAEGDPPVSKKVKAVLKAAGWTPGRRVDTTRYQDALTTEGYPYAQRVGEPLAVIGAAENEYLTLMIGPSGKIYGGYDEFLCELGTELFDALDCLVSARGAREIEE